MHALADPTLLRTVVQSRREPAFADDDEVQTRELAAQEGQCVDELVLALARHKPADADDELTVDAEPLAEARGLVAVRRDEVVHQEWRPKHLRRHLASGLLARFRGGVLTHGEQHGGVAEHVTEQIVHAGHHTGQRDLGAAEEDDVGDTVALSQPRAEQAGGQRVAELDELRSLALGHLLHRVQHRVGRPQDRCGRADDGVRVGRVERGGVDVRRREDRDL